MLQEHTFDSFYTSAWNIYEGEQIFANYGNAWFPERNLTEIETRKHHDKDILRVDDVQNSKSRKNFRIPGCSTMLTTLVNGALFAASDIEIGEIIEVARAVLFPLSLLDESGSLGEWLWLASRDHNQKTAYAIFLFGRGTLYSVANNTQVKNVHYDWWYPMDETSMSADGYFSNCNAINSTAHLPCPVIQKWSPFTEQNLAEACYTDTISNCNKHCDVSMFVSFTASRDIKKGEQLFVDLNIDPARNGRYVRPEFAYPCLYNNKTF